MMTAYYRGRISALSDRLSRLVIVDIEGTCDTAALASPAKEEEFDGRLFSVDLDTDVIVDAAGDDDTNEVNRLLLEGVNIEAG